MEQEEAYFNKIGDRIEDSVKSQLFGKPCYKINGKAFTCFFQEAMVFKLNKNFHSEALALEGSKLFDPSGKNRPMKEWVQVSFEYKDQWEYFATKAAEYVGSS